MRGPLVGSAIFHLAVLLFVFLVRGPAPFIVPGPEVVQVALIEPTAMAAAVAATPPPPPRVEPAEVKPDESEGVKLAPPPRKPPKKEPPPSKQSDLMQAPALPSEAVGNSGLRAEMSLDARDFAFTYYLILVRNRIAQNWSPPAGLSGTGPVQAVLFFRIGRDGTLSGLRIETGSALEFFDRSAMRAVMLSDPMPPLPLGFGGSSLGVHFGFQYASP